MWLKSYFVFNNWPMKSEIRGLRRSVCGHRSVPARFGNTRPGEIICRPNPACAIAPITPRTREKTEHAWIGPAGGFRAYSLRLLDGAGGGLAIFLGRVFCRIAAFISAYTWCDLVLKSLSALITYSWARFCRITIPCDVSEY